MYNGIGLETARGSGTNGYVQRNLSALRRHKEKVDYKSEEELKKLDAQLNRGPNHEILDHERKRKVELKCMEMQELMEEQGYADDEIDKKVNAFRQMLMDKSNAEGSCVELDNTGRPIVKATHQLAEANQLRNEQLKQAFGIGDFYKEGSSFDKERKAKEEAAKTLAMATKKYNVIHAESSDDDDDDDSNKKLRQVKADSSPDSSEQKKKKKNKKHENQSTKADESSSNAHGHSRIINDSMDDLRADSIKTHRRERSIDTNRDRSPIRRQRSSETRDQTSIKKHGMNDQKRGRDRSTGDRQHKKRH